MSNNPRVRELIQKWSKSDYNPFDKKPGEEVEPVMDLNVPPLVRAHVANMFASLNHGSNGFMNHKQVLTDTHQYIQQAMNDYLEAEKIVNRNAGGRGGPSRPSGKIKSFRKFDTPKIGA
jgi:hypothetical protein